MGNFSREMQGVTKKQMKMLEKTIISEINSIDMFNFIQNIAEEIVSMKLSLYLFSEIKGDML
jgi:hypothetical protein